MYWFRIRNVTTRCTKYVCLTRCLISLWASYIGSKIMRKPPDDNHGTGSSWGGQMSRGVSTTSLYYALISGKGILGPLFRVLLTQGLIGCSQGLTRAAVTSRLSRWLLAHFKSSLAVGRGISSLPHGFHHVEVAVFLLTNLRSDVPWLLPSVL